VILRSRVFGFEIPARMPSLRTREFGTIGLAQTLKQLRDSDHIFPMYEDGRLTKGSFSNLGVLKYHRQLDLASNN
jgi:hypothetical protein